MFGKPRIVDPYNTMGGQRQAPATRGVIRPRTAAENKRYDDITRKVIANHAVDPGDFTDTIDYLKWTDRVSGSWTDIPGGITASALSDPRASVGYDDVMKLRGR